MARILQRSSVAAALTLLLIGSASAEPPAPPAPAETATTAIEDPMDRAERARLKAEEEKLIAISQREEGSIDGAAPDDLPSFGGAFLQMIAVLSLVCLLAYLILGRLLPRLMRVEGPTAPRRLLTVVDRLPLDQRRSIMVVKLGEHYFLLGATEAGIGLLSRLDAGDIEDALEKAPAPPASLGKLANALLSRSRKEN